MQDMRSFFGRGIWDTIFLALFDSWRMELPKELKGELLTNDIGLLAKTLRSLALSST
jgi:hypothetical protein